MCLLVLQGCFLPVPVRVASWALNGLSYVTTHKSLTDHGLTLLAKKDCAVWRTLKGEPICEDEEPADTAVAAVEPSLAGSEDTGGADAVATDLAGFKTAAGGPAEPEAAAASASLAGRIAAVVVDVPAVNPLRAILAAAPPPHKPAVPRAASQPIPATVPSAAIASLLLPRTVTGPNIYFVIGSYAERDNADEQASRFAAFGPVIVTARLDGHRLFRVTVGPFRQDALQAGRRALAEAGIFDAWAVRLNPASWTLAGPAPNPSGSLAEATP